MRGRDQYPVLVIEHAFLPAVEEKRHVRIFFRLGDAQLSQPVSGQVLAQHVFQVRGRERGRDPVFRLVLGHAYERAEVRNIFTLETGEIRFRECTRDLPRAIGAIVCEYDYIAAPDAHRRPAAPYNGRGLNELVRLSARISHIHGDERVLRSEVGLALTYQIVGNARAIPVAVAIHRKVAAHDARKPAHAEFHHFQVRIMHVLLRALGRCIAAIQKRVQVQIPDATTGRELHEREDMILMAVHAPG